MTPKQEAFVREYLLDMNATQAAIRAGYSAKTAVAIGHETLRKPEVAEAIAAAQQARAARTEITADRVLQELARIAFFDIRRLYNTDGTLKKPHELDDEAASVLAGVDTTTTNIGGADDDTSLVTKKAKVFDKTAALTLAMRHLGMLTDKLEVRDVTPLGERMRRAEERRKRGR